MPSLSHHFEGKVRTDQPPWGVEAENKNGCNPTTYGKMFQGLRGLPAKAFRNNTTNHFDPQNWRNKSSYQETFYTPQAYSRHTVQNASKHRNHRPHPNEISWPLEPNKGYMIWKPRNIPEEQLRNYTAPNLLRQYNGNNWKTTTQTTYQNFFHHNLQPKQKHQQSQSAQEQRTTQSQLNERQSESRVKDSRLLDSRMEKVHGTPANLKTCYKLTYTGEPTKPSTNAKPGDRSWANIRY